MSDNQAIRMTQSRKAILSALSSSELHPTADEVYSIVRAELPKVSLNTQVAEDIGLTEGDRVWIESSRDKLEAIAKISPHTRKDAVEFFPSVWKNDEGGINRLREAILSDMGPTAAVNETKVTIRKA